MVGASTRHEAQVSADFVAFAKCFVLYTFGSSGRQRDLKPLFGTLISWTIYILFSVGPFLMKVAFAPDGHAAS